MCLPLAMAEWNSAQHPSAWLVTQSLEEQCHWYLTGHRQTDGQRAVHYAQCWTTASLTIKTWDFPNRNPIVSILLVSEGLLSLFLLSLLKAAFFTCEWWSVKLHRKEQWLQQWHICRLSAWIVHRDIDVGAGWMSVLWTVRADTQRNVLTF